MMTIAGGREVLQTAEPFIYIYIYIDIYVYVYIYICFIHIYTGYNMGGYIAILEKKMSATIGFRFRVGGPLIVAEPGAPLNPKP